MDYEGIVEAAREKASKTDISGVDFLAVQINITGKGEGAFYVEVKDGRISVEPYEYYDRQCLITLSGADFLQFLEGTLDPGKAFDEGRLLVDGDLDQALVFADLVQGKR